MSRCQEERKKSKTREGENKPKNKGFEENKSTLLFNVNACSSVLPLTEMS